jgi:hypothetical protein
MGDVDRDSSMATRLHAAVEHFKNKDAAPVYRRFRKNGRMAPEGWFMRGHKADPRNSGCAADQF